MMTELLQVTSLALCKHNKNWMLLGHMSAYWRHERVNEIFWDYDQASSLHSWQSY